MARFLEKGGVKRWGRIVERTDLSQSARGAKKDVTKNNGEGGWLRHHSTLSLSKNGLRREVVNTERQPEQPLKSASLKIAPSGSKIGVHLTSVKTEKIKNLVMVVDLSGQQPFTSVIER
jgi:hypothetical protein